MKGITDLDEGTLRRVDWQELIPATILLRAFSATFKASYLCFGAFLIALFATVFGTFNGGDVATVSNGSAFNESIGFDGSSALRTPFSPIWREEALRIGGEIAATTFRLGEKPRRPFVFWPLRSAVGALALVIAFWFALAVSRTAAVRLASTSRSSTLQSFRFAARRSPSLLLPIFAPILFFCCATFLVAILKASTGSAFGVLSNWFAPFVALFLFAFVVLFAITFVAFPLSATAVAAEKSDGFDAVSRGISYATQRPLHLIAYAAAAFVLTYLGFALVVAASTTTRDLYLQIFYNDGLGRSFSSPWTRFWGDFLTAIPVAYLGICCVVYSAAIYFALRRSVDGTPFDQYADDSTGKKSRRLRPILQDAQGAPTIADSAASSDAGRSKNGVPDADVARSNNGAPVAPNESESPQETKDEI